LNIKTSTTWFNRRSLLALTRCVGGRAQSISVGFELVSLTAFPDLSLLVKDVECLHYGPSEMIEIRKLFLETE
jgi:hypothetical protein